MAVAQGCKVAAPLQHNPSNILCHQLHQLYNIANSKTLKNPRIDVIAEVHFRIDILIMSENAKKI